MARKAAVDVSGLQDYILVQDNDFHWYVIPDSKEEEWNKWCEIDSGDEESWDVPEYAVMVGGSPSLVKFKKYWIK